MNINTYIISYPKSGRTWLRALIGKYLSKKHNLPNKKLLETEYITKVSNIPIARFTHDGAEWTQGNPLKLLLHIEYYNLPKNKSKYKNKNVILLQRDIKDTVVSAYFQSITQDII